MFVRFLQLTFLRSIHLIGLSFLFSKLPAQAPVCDVNTDQRFLDHFDRLIESLPENHRRATTSTILMPLVFHIETVNGNPVYQVNTLLNKLALVNTYFVPANIQFVNCAPILYYTDGNSDRINNIVNVYLNNGPSGCGSYIGSTININVNCNRTFEHILAHELGHAMGLPHTHGFTNNGTTTELVDGSNCTTDGDRFCDTPADPNLLGKVNGACMYTGTATDANGQEYQPDTTNIMSYTRSTCADKFSPEQHAKMYMVAQALNYECCRIDPPETSDTTICAGTSVTLSATSNLVNGEIRWYDVPQGGSPISTGPSFSTGILQASKAYYVEVADSCISERSSILVTVSPSGGLLLYGAMLFADLDTSSHGSNPYFFSQVDDSTHVFSTQDQTIYKLSSLQDTVQILTDTFRSAIGLNISGLLPLDSDLIVAINDFNAGPSLWKFNMSTGQGEQLKAFGLDYGYSNFWLTAHDQVLYAQLNNIVSNPGLDIAELWKTDGTANGTELVKNLAPTNAFGNFEFTSFQGQLFFVASAEDTGEELWVTDGTTLGTMVLKDIFPGPSGSQISQFTVHRNQLLFVANDSLHGQELWKSDGTAAGTVLAVDINSGSNGSSIGGMTSIASNLFFSADDGIIGSEPYVSDATAAGTILIADIKSDGGSSPYQFTHLDGAVYFTANQSTFDYELFKYEINSQQISLVKDINPTGSSSPGNLFAFENQLFFTAQTSGIGSEIWVSDGTLAGTQLIEDIYEGAQSSFPHQFFSSGGRLHFVANDGNGAELWSIELPDHTVCYGDSISVETMNQQSIFWYADSLGTQLLGQGPVLQMHNIKSAYSIYPKIVEGNCSRFTTPLVISLKENCPCLGPQQLMVNETFGNFDQFTLHAEGQILSESQLLMGSEIGFTAVESIQMREGFEVNNGALFEAAILPCPEE